MRQHRMLLLMGALLIAILVSACGGPPTERLVGTNAKPTSPPDKPAQEQEVAAPQEVVAQPVPDSGVAGDTPSSGGYLIGTGEAKTYVIDFWTPGTYQGASIYFEQLPYYKRSEAVEFNGFVTGNDPILGRGKLHISMATGIENIPGEMVVFITCRDIDPVTGASGSNRRTLYFGVNALTKPGDKLFYPVGIAAHSFWYDEDKKRDWGEPMRLIGFDAEKKNGFKDDQFWKAPGVFGIEHPSGTTVVYRFIVGVNVSFPEGKQITVPDIEAYIDQHMAEIATFVD